jgi:hypothetical protein
MLGMPITEMISVLSWLPDLLPLATQQQQQQQQASTGAQIMAAGIKASVLL